MIKLCVYICAHIFIVIKGVLPNLTKITWSETCGNPKRKPMHDYFHKVLGVMSTTMN